ncbi:unnamed protein product [Blepharisma stoltei]|uniref:Palmitoyltransferase n=1 Tax=Blepharisma stoltei TaxID=1481888 RepID=A0AAU9K3G8_9CILI|nr:unnamed protein product [Blepharisma stoltei]
MRRKNGFSKPLGCHQILSWVVVFSMVNVFYILYIPAFNSSAISVITFLYSVALFLTLFWGFRATYADPLDQVVAEELRAKKWDLPFDAKKYNQICTVCNTHVTFESKHCGNCDKCIDGFDHHCNWLNNCVGKKNYAFFAYLIASLEALTGIQGSVGIYIVQNIISNNDVKNTLEDRLGIDSGGMRVFYVCIVLFFTFISVLIFILNGNLIGFHIWLKKKGMSTYDFILQRRGKEKFKSKRVVPQIQKDDIEEGNRTADVSAVFKKESK